MFPSDEGKNGSPAPAKARGIMFAVRNSPAEAVHPFSERDAAKQRVCGGLSTDADALRFAASYTHIYTYIYTYIRTYCGGSGTAVKAVLL